MAADRLQTFVAPCQGGLLENVDALTLASRTPGAALSLINYEPSLNGGYRRISGFTNTYGTVTGTGSILGVYVAAGINNGLFACRTPSSGNNYLHYWNGSSWTAVTTAGTPTMTGVSRVRFSKFNWSGPKIMLTDGINPAATWDGTTYTQITHADAPTDPKYSEAFANHMFLAGDPAEDYNVYFSAPDDETNYATASGAGVINVGFKVVQIKTFRNALYIFGENHIKKITGTSSSDFKAIDVTTELGCLSSDTVIEFNGSLLFLGPDGMRPISATDRIDDVELNTVTRSIQSTFEDVIFTYDLSTLSVVTVSKKSQFRIFTSTADTTGVLGAIRKGPTVEENLEYAHTYGLSGTCAASGFIGDDEYVIHGDSSGKVHRQETGTDFDGSNILSVFQTPFFYMDDPVKRKTMYSVNTYLQTEGTSEILLSAIYDYEDPNAQLASNYTLDAGAAAAVYEVATYDGTDVYDANPSPVRKTNLEGSGETVSLRYVTYNTSPSHNIQATVITYGLDDRD